MTASKVAFFALLAFSGELVFIMEPLEVRIVKFVKATDVN